MIKPIKILLFFVWITGIFIGFSYFIPEEGIPFNIGNLQYSIKGFPVKSFLFSDIKKEDKDSIKSGEAALLTDSIVYEEVNSVVPDSVIAVEDSVDIPLEHKKDSLFLVYNPEFKKELYKFYERLKHCGLDGKLVRILHMGDSQIEGDRITKYLREKWQEEFKGSGPGLISVYDPKKQFSSLWIENDGDWSEHLVYEYPRDILKNEYGLLGKVAKVDSGVNSSISFVRSFLALPKAKRYYKARLFLNEVTAPVYISASYEGVELPESQVDVGPGLTEMSWTFKSAPKKFTLQFRSEKSPVYLGMSLDSLAGVAVDNISMRGQYTPRLDKNNLALFSSMAGYMNIGMVVLQYGTNMVPTVSKNYSFYATMLLHQLKLFKKMLPDVPVVVIGVGDAGSVVEGKATSFEHVKLIRDAQKKATLEAGYAFFDLYDAMGGEGSIVKWVEGKPRMAMADYTHFNKAGGEKVAEWIYRAIMKEYPMWLQDEKRTQININQQQIDTLGTITGNN